MSTHKPVHKLFSSFVHNCQKLLSEWINKLWYSHKMEYYSVIEMMSYQGA